MYNRYVTQQNDPRQKGIRQIDINHSTEQSDIYLNGLYHDTQHNMVYLLFYPNLFAERHYALALGRLSFSRVSFS